MVTEGRRSTGISRRDPTHVYVTLRERATTVLSEQELTEKVQHLIATALTKVTAKKTG